MSSEDEDAGLVDASNEVLEFADQEEQDSIVRASDMWLEKVAFACGRIRFPLEASLLGLMVVMMLDDSLLMVVSSMERKIFVYFLYCLLLAVD